jgi:hypothetical protein
MLGWLRVVLANVYYFYCSLGNYFLARLVAFESFCKRVGMGYDSLVVRGGDRICDVMFVVIR